MRILIIGPIPISLGGREHGGVCTHITGLSNSLSNKNHKVTLWNYKYLKANNSNNINVINNSYFSFIKAIFMGAFLFFNKKISFLTIKEKLLYIYQFYRLKKILQNNNFDIIHVHSLKNSVPLVLNQLKNKLPIVITDHGFWNQEGVFNTSTSVYVKAKKNIEIAKKIIYISDFAKTMHDVLNLNHQEKLIKISNPLKIIDYDMVDKKKKEKKTIFFNGLTKSIAIKNLPILLNALQKDITLQKKIKLIAIVNKAGLNYLKLKKYDFEIEVFNAVPWKKVVEFYKQSDLLVVPSKSDSFGLVYIEALSYGMPVIGLDKLINEFKKTIGCYIGEPFDSNIESAQKLSAKIKKALNTNFEFEKVSSQLKLKFSWENNINNYIKLYTEVLGENE